MDIHYHVFMGAANAAPMASAKIDDYDESIRKFLRLCKGVYGQHEHFAGELNYPNLLQASGYGDAKMPMTLGTSALCIQWTPCVPPCMSPSWN